MTPLKLVCYFEKCFQKFKTAATTAVTAVVAVYYIKTASTWLQSCSASYDPPQVAATTAATVVVVYYIKTA